MLYYFLIIKNLKKGDYFMHIQSTNILKSLSNEQLLSQTKNLVQKERKLAIQVIGHLSEIEHRKLYLRRGFSSLFDYTVKELGYSEGSAYRRIKAMKLCREIPETTSKLKTGSLNLTTASQLQTFFEKQNKKIKENQSSLLKNTQKQDSQKNLNTQLQNKDSLLLVIGCVIPETKCSKDLQRSDSSARRIDASYLENKTQRLDLLKKFEGKSSRQTEKMLCEIDPEVYQVKEKIRYLGKNQVEIKLTLDKNSYENIEQLKNILSHKNPNMSYGELFSVLVKLGLDKYDPRRKLKKRDVKKFKKQIQIRDNKQSKVCHTSISKQVAFRASSKNILSNTKTKQVSNRYISAGIRRLIWTRDRGECSYICPETKKRCGSKHLLQIDHIHPYSLGGGSKSGNLRLLCAGHNQYRNNN